MEILVVDDRADERILFEQRSRRKIREGVLEFTFTFSGEETPHYFTQKAHYLEIILTLSDINTAGMSDLELLRNTKR